MWIISCKLFVWVFWLR